VGNFAGFSGFCGGFWVFFRVFWRILVVFYCDFREFLGVLGERRGFGEILVILAIFEIFDSFGGF